MYTFTIDWLSATFPSVDAQAFAKQHFLASIVPSKKTRGMFGYDTQVKYETGVLRLSSKTREDMGEHFIFSGSSLINIMDKSGKTAFDICQMFDDYNARVSRLDFAVDVRNENLTPEMLYRASQNQRLEDAIVDGFNGKKSKKRGRRPMTNFFKNSYGGTTFYVGSRTSDKFLRVYDKASQMGTQDNEQWTRIELECKGEIAHSLGWHAARSDQQSFYNICSAYIKSVFDCGNPVWNAALSQSSAILDIPKKDKKDTIAWLMKTVAPTIARIIEENPSVDVWGEFCQRIEDILKGKDAYIG